MDSIRELEEGSRFAPDFEKRGGLLPCVVQEVQGGEVLMLAYVNRAAVELSISSGYASFYSTSRKALWTKGESSGNRLEIKNILVDCDQDALLYQVELEGAGACHTLNEADMPRHSCFYRELDPTAAEPKLRHGNP